ncbi:pantoate--beta-alanine ligase [Sphingomonas piscis]|uniref:Pantothenate synthetase n=1 Tax=Sphingomonas piscis TaxID=2714943 RepID=A0A6G7YQ91_9SPHN|nr:pantoate--beta-alanine ligase [Sphingomonas piscis]QIK78904.1 pantoate--beta-alanine ligase [Sphingomonas piscis]
MQIIRDVQQLENATEALRRRGSLALVPTMGALHPGHLSLIAEGLKRADAVAATIFVNPLQFNDPGDLDRYPRTEDADLAALEQAGCALVWLPAPQDLYPEGFATTVSVAGVSDRWEGEHRPGHFAGVATVVAKLLIAFRPGVALFGEKDWQQLAVIRRMVADLGLGIDIVGVPTVRQEDGLALSSRNVHLSAQERANALALPQALTDAAQSIRAGADVPVTLAAAKAKLADAGFDPIDYLALVDAATLEPLDAARGDMRLIAAAVIGKTRLIDNMPV